MPSNAFTKAVAFTLDHEGGYVNDPDDPGGETNHGICKRYHPDVDIKNLTVKGATLIYLAEYWNARNLRLYELTAIPLSYPAALATFDAGVNPGPLRAGQFLQVALNRLGGQRIKVDGWVGPKTRDKVRALIMGDPYRAALLAHEITARRLNHYCLLRRMGKFQAGLSLRCADMSRAINGWAMDPIA